MAELLPHFSSSKKPYMCVTTLDESFVTLIRYKRFILATAWYTHTYTHTQKQANNTELTYPCCVRHTVCCVLPCSVLLHTILCWKSNGMAWNVCLTNYKPSFETNAVYWKDRGNIQESSKTERLRITVVRKGNRRKPQLSWRRGQNHHISLELSALLFIFLLKCGRRIRFCFILLHRTHTALRCWGLNHAPCASWPSASHQTRALFYVQHPLAPCHSVWWGATGFLKNE